MKNLGNGSYVAKSHWCNFDFSKIFYSQGCNWKKSFKNEALKDGKSELAEQMLCVPWNVSYTKDISWFYSIDSKLVL